MQIDSVNVLVRSHYLPAFSRLGAYDRAHLDTLAHRAPRALFEYWGHEASLLPVALQPLFRWRMDARGAPRLGHVRKVAHEQPDFVRKVLDLVRDKGPIAASDLDSRRAEEGLVGVERCQERDRVAVLERPGDERGAPRLRAALRSARARAAAGVLAAPTPSEADAHVALVERLGPCARRRHRDRPPRLLPAAAMPARARRRRARRAGRARCR